MVGGVINQAVPVTWVNYNRCDNAEPSSFVFELSDGKPSLPRNLEAKKTCQSCRDQRVVVMIIIGVDTSEWFDPDRASGAARTSSCRGVEKLR